MFDSAMMIPVEQKRANEIGVGFQAFDSRGDRIEIERLDLYFEASSNNEGLVEALRAKGVDDRDIDDCIIAIDKVLMVSKLRRLIDTRY